MIGCFMTKTKLIITLLFLIVLFIIVVFFFRNNRDSKSFILYDDLDSLTSARYGLDYTYITHPPLQNKFQLSDNDLVFNPNDTVEGKFLVTDGNFTYGFPFSYEADPDNYTIIFAAKGQSSSGWSKVVIKVNSLQKIKTRQN